MSASTWLVTGASSGVGRSLAVALASQGAQVILTGRQREALEDTARWCAGSVVVLAGLADPGSVDRLASGVLVDPVRERGVAVAAHPLARTCVARGAGSPSALRGRGPVHAEGGAPVVGPLVRGAGTPRYAARS